MDMVYIIVKSFTLIIIIMFNIIITITINKNININENYLKLVSADDQAALAKIKSRLANGEITVSTAYGMDSATLNALINSVK